MPAWNINTTVSQKERDRQINELRKNWFKSLIRKAFQIVNQQSNIVNFREYVYDHE
jgi:hypothetical protein